MFYQLFVLLILLTSSEVNGQNWLLPYLLPSNYSARIIPLKTNESLPVNITFKMNSFQVNEAKMSLTADLNLCLKWYDYRLRSLTSVPDINNSNETLNYSFIRLTDITKLWIPNLYFRNGFTASTVNSLIKIQYLDIWPSQKKVSFCSRISSNVFCYFNLARFPFDYNYCNVEMESTEESNLEDNRIVFHIEWVEVPTQNGKMRIRNYFIDRCSPLANDFMSNRNGNRSNSCAMVRIMLMRHLGYWVIRYYASTFLMVCTSLLELWLPVNAWPARVILTCTVLMTLNTVSLNGYNEIPAPYMTAFYWWFWGCQFFILMCLVEYAFALAWSHFISDKLDSQATGVPSPDGHYFGKRGCFRWWGKVLQCMTHCCFGPVRHHEDHFNRNKVDYVFRVLMPILFLIFVFVYLVSTVPAWSDRYML